MTMVSQTEGFVTVFYFPPLGARIYHRAFPMLGQCFTSEFAPKSTPVLLITYFMGTRVLSECICVHSVPPDTPYRPEDNVESLGVTA